MALLTQPSTGCRQRALKALADLPPFSPVLDRLLATLSNQSVSIARVSDIVETDAVIAGNVLRLVNSAMYGRRGTVNSVRHAVSLLGINKLRNAVFAMSITRVWRNVHTAAGWSTARFNLHSVGCGLLCDSLAQRRPVTYPEGAFAAGLFHDLGRLLIALTLQSEFEEIQELHASGFGVIEDCEREVIGVSHSELSADALAVWNLPSAIQQAVRYHHTPEADCTPANGNYGLALTVHCANAYLENCGTPLFNREADPDRAKLALAPLGVELESADFLEQFRTEFDVIAGFVR